jgi:hypothetical protein
MSGSGTMTASEIISNPGMLSLSSPKRFMEFDEYNLAQE